MKMVVGRSLLAWAALIAFSTSLHAQTTDVSVPLTSKTSMVTLAEFKPDLEAG